MSREGEHYTMQLYRQKYRMGSARCPGYNYSQNGCYFITICTKNREHHFGNIVDGIMKLSGMGKIVSNEWKNTPNMRTCVFLGPWVVMPNHFHTIIIIDNDHGFNQNTVDTHCAVDTHCNAYPPFRKNFSSYTHIKSSDYKNKFGPQSKNISAIIRGFKGAVTKQIIMAGFSDFAWQSRFHDRIIRDDTEYHRIARYIMNNPKNWKNDKNYH